MGSQMYKFGSLRQLCLKNSDHVVVSITQPVAVSTNTVTYRPQELQPSIGTAVVPSTLNMPSSVVSKCRITRASLMM